MDIWEDSMFYNKIFVVEILVALATGGCSVATRENATAVFTPETAKVCVADALQAISHNPREAKRYVDTSNLRRQISDAFEVDDFFIFFHQRAVKVVINNILTRFAAGSGNIVINGIYDAEDGYRLTGEIGGVEVEINAHFFTSGKCKIADVKLGGISLSTAIVGRLGSEPAFAARIETDPYE